MVRFRGHHSSTVYFYDVRVLPWFYQNAISDVLNAQSSLRGFSYHCLSPSFSDLKEGIFRMARRNSPTHTPSEQEAITSSAIQIVASGLTKRLPVDYLSELISKICDGIDSQKSSFSAEESFKRSRELATIAFGSSYLSIRGKIMACKLRIANSILEKFLNDPKAAAQDCLQYLKELHDLPAVRQTFTVHIRKRFKSPFKKRERSKIVESITALNMILSDLMQTFELHMGVFGPCKWPATKLTDSKLPGKYIIENAESMQETVMEKFTDDRRPKSRSDFLDNLDNPKLNEKEISISKVQAPLASKPLRNQEGDEV